MKTKVICTDCKGEDVLLDTLAVWNVEKQDWVVFDVAEPRAFCRDCDTDVEWDMVDIESGVPHLEKVISDFEEGNNGQETN